MIGYFLCLCMKTLSTKKEKQYVLSWVCLVGTYSWKDLKSHPDDERSWHSHISSLVSTFINWCFHLIESDFSEGFPIMFIGRRMFFMFTKGGNGKIFILRSWICKKWIWGNTPEVLCEHQFRVVQRNHLFLDWRCLNPQRRFFQVAVVFIRLNGGTN